MERNRMIDDYANIIKTIKIKYKDDKELLSMLGSLAKIYDEMKTALKNHEFVYEISDYTDEEIRDLDSEVVCDLFQYQIYKLIKIYSKDAVDISFRDSCEFLRNGYFSIGYSYRNGTYDSPVCYDGFDVSIKELRNPELYKTRRARELEKEARIKREKEIEELEKRLAYLKRTK